LELCEYLLGWKATPAFLWTYFYHRIGPDEKGLFSSSILSPFVQDKKLFMVSVKKRLTESPL
jgi:hypothetical protein